MKNYDQIRIIASAEGTTVLDANRKSIANVFGVTIALRPNKPPVMQINLIAGAFDVQGKALFMAADPAGGAPKPVKSIEFYDGTGLTFPEPPPVTVTMQPPNGGQTAADPEGAKPITPPADVQPETDPTKIN
jgi:hypothetical protein